MSETDLKNQIMIDVSRDDCRLFKFQCGNFELVDGRWISVGVPGMSDLQGWTEVRITSDMVGKKVAVYTSIEVKTPGGRTDRERKTKQMAWLNAVESCGGIAGIAHSCDEAHDVVLCGIGRMKL